MTIEAGDLIDFAVLAKAFGDEHERTYGHQAEAEEVESVALRAVATVVVDKTTAAAAPERVEARTRAAFFGADHGRVEVDVIGRAGLGAEPRSGPLIVEEYDATCVVPPGWSAALDADGNIVLHREGS